MKFKITVMFFLIASFVAVSARAAVYTVTNNSNDYNTPGSFGWAVMQANLDPNFDVIEFRIPSENPNDPPQKQVIQFNGEYAQFLYPVLIDGWSQLGTQTVNIEIKNGGLTFEGAYGIGKDFEIRGMALRDLGVHSATKNINIHDNFFGLGFDGETNIETTEGQCGLILWTTKDVVVKNNYIGNSSLCVIDSSQISIRGNKVGFTYSGQKAGSFMGIRVSQSSDVVIGGDQQEDRNMIAGQEPLDGSTDLGAIVLTSVKNSIIKNNYIGI